MEFFFTYTIPVELTLGITLSLILFLIAGLQQLWRPSSKMNKSHQEKRLLPLPPGQFGIPLIGETLEFLRTQKEGRPQKFFDDRIASYGETFKSSIVGFPTVILASPAGNKTAFSNSHVLWPASMVSILGKHSLIGNMSKSRSLRIRNAFTTFLRPESLQRYMSSVDLIVFTFIKEQLAGKSNVFLLPLMKKLTFCIACKVLVGRSDGKDQDMLLLPFTTMVKGLLQIPIRIPGTRYHKALAASDEIRQHLQVWIDERRRDMASGLVTEQPEDILSGLLAYKDEHGEALTDMEVKDNILLLLNAGHDTSTVAATMACKFLASNPHIMDEVYRENMEIAASKAPGENLKWGDIQKMKLSWRVVQESMRLVPPVPGSFRVPSEDMSFHGFMIPKSWKIYWSVHSTHRNPKYFPEPEKFDPSRFEGAGPAPFTFVPFGGGPRMCPGNEFARMVILTIIHHLVTNFSWALEDPNEAVLVDPMPFPVKGLPILLEPRNA